MNKFEMPVSEQLDLAGALFKSRDLITEAYLCGLPRLVDAELTSKINALLDGVLNTDLKLSSNFREVLVNVLGNRDIQQATYDDFEVVASRYEEWHPAPLSSDWHSEIYRSR